jgi:ABC-type uncharacterized transport system auxiliary subunit
MTMRRRIGAAAAAAYIALLASGCALFAERPTTHRYLLPPPKVTVTIPADLNIRIRSVTGVAPFEDTGIAHQTSAYQLDSYQYYRWVAPPTEMVADALNELVKPRANGAGGKVVQELMMLDARVNAFQQVDFAGKDDGLVSIEFCFSSDRPLAACRWRRSITRQIAAANNSPVSAVAAMGAAYDQVLTEFATTLSAFLSGHQTGA